MTHRISQAMSHLMRDGWTLLQLSTDETAMLSDLNTTAADFFRAPHDVRARSQWTGHGMWAGFQPMPDGDPDVIDLVDRFEVAAQHLAQPAGNWPWLSEEANSLRTALLLTQQWAHSIVAESIGHLAQLNGTPADVAQHLWCTDDSSTLVVNNYHIPEAGPAAPAELMKPHADFGGLTIIHTRDGLDALQFDDRGTWKPARPAGIDDEPVAVLLIGQLLAHWLGTEAPIHRVVRLPAASRMSTVYFHQPNLSARIPGRNGQPPLHAGQHISAMQDHYNQLGAAAQS